MDPDTLTYYFLQSLQLPDENEIEGTDELEQKTLPQFLLLVFKEPEEKEEILMENIGIKGSALYRLYLFIASYLFFQCLCSLPQSQLEYLHSLKLPFLYSTLEQFVEWVRDGMYDFHQLPLVMRKHLEPQDEVALNSFQSSYKGILCIIV